jgi:hypothetical protein
MSTLNSVQAALAAKAGHPPAPEVEQAVAATQLTQPTPEAESAAGVESAPPETVQIEQGDHAGNVLQHAPINHNVKADIWDEVYRAPNADVLARSLKSFDIPSHVVAALIVAKRLLDTEHPEPSRADKVKSAGQQMSAIPKETLDLMERHPNVMKHLLSEPSKKD